MAQIRLGVERVRVGSAAQQAEGETAAAGQPVLRRIPAGSAARMAEEAKRAEAEGRPAVPTLSFRATGGRVQRIDAARPASQPPTPEAAQAIPSAGASAPLPQVAPPRSALATGPSAVDGVRRLKTFFRELFEPEAPSQP